MGAIFWEFHNIYISANDEPFCHDAAKPSSSTYVVQCSGEHDLIATFRH